MGKPARWPVASSAMLSPLQNQARVCRKRIFIFVGDVVLVKAEKHHSKEVIREHVTPFPKCLDRVFEFVTAIFDE